MSPTSDSQAVTKKFLDDALTHVHGTINQVANPKVGYALLTYGGSNISIGDELVLVSSYNDIGTLNRGKLIFTQPGVLKANIQLNRSQVSTDQITLQFHYNEKDLRDGSSIVKHINASIHKDEEMNSTFGFIDVKKDTTIQLMSNSNIPDLEVFVELMQIYV